MGKVREPIINGESEKSIFSSSRNMAIVMCRDSQGHSEKPLYIELLVIYSAGINIHITNVSATRKH